MEGPWLSEKKWTGEAEEKGEKIRGDQNHHEVNWRENVEASIDILRDTGQIFHSRGFIQDALIAEKVKKK